VPPSAERVTAPPKEKTLTAAKEPISPAPEKPAEKPGPARSGGLGAPLVPRGATVLQVAATVRQADALMLAKALQQKKFPAFVLNPSSDRYYRVQVGPYADAESATIARRRLEDQGFKSIVKR
jgi:cell division septation protein DedD